MISKTTTSFLLMFLFGTSVWAESNFLVSPYLIIEDQGHVSLNFRPLRDQELEVRVNRTGTEVVHSRIWSGKELSKIDLGKIHCGEPLQYKIISKTQTELDHAIHSIPCDEKKPLYFGFMSDTQIKNEAGQARATSLSKTVSEIQKTIPFALIVNGGDIVQHGGFEEEWVNFFNTASPYSKTSYVMAAVGNHEYYESPSVDKAPPQFLEYMRNNHSSELGNLQLVLGKLNFLMLNSNFESMTEGKIQEQWKWLEEKLESGEREGKITLIVMHHSPYSSNLEHLRTIPARLRSELVPLLERHKSVKMVLSGHLHMYERSLKSNIVYLTAGPSGGINNVISYKNPYSVFIKQFTTTFSIIKYENDKLDVATYSGPKTVIDRFSVSLK